MRTYPTREQVESFASDKAYTTVPVSVEILSDFTTPIQVLRILKNVSKHVYILESATTSGNTYGRYTFLGFNPKRTITVNDGVTLVDGTEREGAPSDVIRSVLKDYRAPSIEGLPPFTGGLVGYFAYDYIKYAEPTLRLDSDANEGFKDADLMLFDQVIAFDNFKQRLILINHVRLDNVAENYAQATANLESLMELLHTGTPSSDTKGKLLGEVKPDIDKESFVEMVKEAQKHIEAGEIEQIVLSNRLSAPFEGSLCDAYRHLRSLNPSPYMFYFSGTDIEVAGASPETLVKVDNGDISTFPLAGTRPRGATPEEDAQLEAELLQDPKELEEHEQLVELGITDISKVAATDTVRVEDYRSVLKYSHVMHIGSTVRGQLADDKDALDAIEAILPAGTLSGAPKTVACQLINDLEGIKRGVYGGALGYIDFAGNLDCCITIRIAYRLKDKVYVRSGAGIVAQSVPEKEYVECVNKAAAVVAALQAATEDNDVVTPH